MWHAAGIICTKKHGVVQKAASAECIIFKYVNATEQHFAFLPKQRHVVKNIAYASWGICYTSNFYN